MKNNIYLAYTPYHILLSYGLSRKLSYESNNILYIVPNFRDKALIKLLLTANTKEHIFSKIIMLNSNYPYHVNRVSPIYNIIWALKSEILNKKILKRELKQKSNVFVFNDALPESQILLYYNKKAMGKNYYIEDGSALYTPHNLFPHFRAKLNAALHKLLMPEEYVFLSSQATSPYIDYILATFPKLVKEDVNSEKILPLPREVLDISDSKFFKNIVKYYKLENISSLKTDIVIVCPANIYDIAYSYKIPIKSIITVYANVIDILKDNNITILLKLHPREKSPIIDMLKERFGKEVVFVPSSIPLEVLFLFLRENSNIRGIIGDISTTLLTFRLVFPKTLPAVSIANILNTTATAEWLARIKILKKFSILIPKNFNELRIIFRTNSHKGVY